MFIDYQKAYASVHWKFLIESLRYLNFRDKFIQIYQMDKDIIQ